MASEARFKLVRRWLTERTTIGELFFPARVERPFVCFILEDFRREPGQPKVYGRTCIPEGTYRFERTPSKKFGRVMPLVWNIELPDGRKLVRSADGKVQFEGIRAHTGRNELHTEGCLITGRQRGMNEVLESQAAFDELDAMIERLEAERALVWLDIEMAPPNERLVS